MPAPIRNPAKCASAMSLPRRELGRIRARDAPEVLLDCVKELYGKSPRAFLITIGGEDFCIGEGLTEGAEPRSPRSCTSSTSSAAAACNGTVMSSLLFAGAPRRITCPRHEVHEDARHRERLCLRQRLRRKGRRPGRAGHQGFRSPFRHRRRRPDPDRPLRPGRRPHAHVQRRRVEAEMCGNGVRCVAKYAFDHGLSRSNPMRIETGRGVLTLDLQVQGKVTRPPSTCRPPILELPKIPVDAIRLKMSGDNTGQIIELGDLVRRSHLRLHGQPARGHLRPGREEHRC